MNLQKQELRNSLRRELSQLDTHSHLDKSQKLSINLEGLMRSSKLSNCQNIAVFAPFGTEPKWQLNLESINRQTCFPALKNQKMEFFPSSFEDLALDNCFGVPIRVPKNLKDPVQPDAIILPGLGFDKKGNRLGRGKGYYDKYLAEFRPKVAIGVCFEFQVIENIPAGEWDQLVDIICTDEKVHLIKEIQ